MGQRWKSFEDIFCMAHTHYVKKQTNAVSQVIQEETLRRPLQNKGQYGIRLVNTLKRMENHAKCEQFVILVHNE